MPDTTSMPDEALSALAAARELVAALGQQAESAKTALAELNAVSAAAREAGTQAKDGAAQVAVALEAIRTIANAATESASRAEALRTQIEQTAQVAAQRSQHIEDGRAYVDTKRAEIDVILNTAQLSANSAEAEHQAGRALVENITAYNPTTQTLAATVSANAEATGAARAGAEKDATVTARLAQIAEATEAKVREYEESLGGLLVAAKRQQKTIEELLLGATNAGLASSFDKRAKSFKGP
jgi:hypothetical protein